MSDLVQIVEKLGKRGPYKTFKAMVADLISESGGTDFGLKAVKLRGNGGDFLPIFHDVAGKRILMWSDSLERIVDLAKLVPKPITPPTCYATMIGWAKREGGLSEMEEEIVVGNIDSYSMKLIARTLSGPRNLYGVVGAQMIFETIQRSYPEALV